MRVSEGPETLLTLAHLLRAQNQNSCRLALPFSEQAWSALISAAKVWEITGSVCLALQQSGAQTHVPLRWRKYFIAYQELCKARNRRVLAVAKDVSEQCRHLGFPCLLLKGAAMLAIGEEEMLGVWAMHDVDVLVPPEAQERLVDALRKSGYRTARAKRRVLRKPVLIYPLLHHAPPLDHPELNISVEVHKDVGIQRRLLSSKDALAAAVEVNGFLVPRPVHMVVHNCFHSEVQDRAFSLGIIPLKALLQLDWLLRHDKFQQVDWNEFWARMRDGSCARTAHIHLEMSRWLLDTPVPELRYSRLSAQLHRNRCMVQLRFPFITRLCGVWLSLIPNLNHAVLEYRSGQSGVLTLPWHFRRRAFAHKWRLPSLVRSMWSNTRR